MKNKKEKILFFTKELTIMLKSGITFMNSIEILLKEEKEKNFKQILKKIYKNLASGKNIFNSFKEFSNIWGNTYLYMLKVGELTGTLEQRLEDISNNIEFELETKKKIGGILIYPLIVLCLTFIIVSFLLIFILPNFISIFEENNIELPFVTKILIFISRTFHFILIFIIFIVFLLFSLNKHINNNKFKKIKKDHFILKFPIFGEIIKLSLAAELYHSLFLLLSVGHSLIDGIDILYMNTNNFYIKENLLLVKRSLLSGENISNSFKKLDLYNSRFSLLITSGEESGNLAENFFQISKILKQDFEYNLKKKIAFIEPITVIFLGMVVAFIVIAIYLPILSVGEIFN